MKRVIIASKADDYIYVLLRNGDPIAKGSYEQVSKKSVDMSVPTDIKKFSKSKFNSYFKMAKEARRPNPLKFAVNRYINDNREEFREINSATDIGDNFIYDLATRLVKFMQDYDWFDYVDFTDMDESEEDVIESTANSLTDRKYAKTILDTLNYILSNEPEVDEQTISGLIDDLHKLL